MKCIVSINNIDVATVELNDKNPIKGIDYWIANEVINNNIINFLSQDDWHHVKNVDSYEYDDAELSQDGTEWTAMIEFEQIMTASAKITFRKA